MAPAAPLTAGPTIGADLLHALPGALREHQATFETTGGLHAAGLFDTAGRMSLLREDVGRHNAVGKLIGALLLADARTVPKPSRSLSSSAVIPKKPTEPLAGFDRTDSS